MWIGGCNEKSADRKGNSSAKGIPTSLQMPLLGDVSVTGTGCLTVDLFKDNGTLKYELDDPHALHDALCAVGK